MRNLQIAGFTLLELLLVVGVGALLTLGGITTYNLVYKNYRINETIRLYNLVNSNLRNMHKGANTYGPPNASLSDLLINSRSLPMRYLDSAGNQITSPFGGSCLAYVDPNPMYYGFWCNVPRAYSPEIALGINNSDMLYIRMCDRVFWPDADFDGDEIDRDVSLARFSEVCGSDKDNNSHVLLIVSK